MAPAIWLAMLGPPMVASALVLAIVVAVAQGRDDLPRWLRGAIAYALVAVAFVALTCLMYYALYYARFWK